MGVGRGLLNTISPLLPWFQREMSHAPPKADSHAKLGLLLFVVERLPASHRAGCCRMGWAVV
jgi:hypothetical protein